MLKLRKRPASQAFCTSGHRSGKTEKMRSRVRQIMILPAIIETSCLRSKRRSLRWVQIFAKSDKSMASVCLTISPSILNIGTILRPQNTGTSGAGRNFLQTNRKRLGAPRLLNIRTSQRKNFKNELTCSKNHDALGNYRDIVFEMQSQLSDDLQKVRKRPGVPRLLNIRTSQRKMVKK